MADAPENNTLERVDKVVYDMAVRHAYAQRENPLDMTMMKKAGNGIAMYIDTIGQSEAQQFNPRGVQRIEWQRLEHEQMVVKPEHYDNNQVVQGWESIYALKDPTNNILMEQVAAMRRYEINLALRGIYGNIEYHTAAGNHSRTFTPNKNPFNHATVASRGDTVPSTYESSISAGLNWKKILQAKTLLAEQSVDMMRGVNLLVSPEDVRALRGVEAIGSRDYMPGQSWSDGVVNHFNGVNFIELPSHFFDPSEISPTDGMRLLAMYVPDAVCCWVWKELSSKIVMLDETRGDENFGLKVEAARAVQRYHEKGIVYIEVSESA